jgi:hypothetical protein
MQIPKLQVLIEAGVVRAVEVAYAAQRLDLLIAAQRRQVAHTAGEHWQPLLDYLSGKLQQLPEG